MLSEILFDDGPHFGDSGCSSYQLHRLDAQLGEIGLGQGFVQILFEVLKMGAILHNLPVYVGVQIDAIHECFDVYLRLLVCGKSLLDICALD